ncbi:TRAP transporter substrate-binding protein [Acuticoccus sp. M5D2P5]|uniref:TRAP transporter substrate-binding protein n=1 Tax=Acuticoccus kalidii TaxID=2910977 RepID=UPI001F1EB0AC|nr:TRAP transporter substrate-binding protein [Acuticoccus kalidii]MCF3934567.1 TRAP transporter substrate-binding protein [Acuticoccus kalidii]
MRLTTLCAVGLVAFGTSLAHAETLRLGHGQDPSDPVHTASKKFAEAVSEKTGGAVDVRIFPSSSLGDYQQMQEALQQGGIDIVIESIGTLSRYHPLAGVESMPYLFDDAAHYAAVWNGPVGEELKATIADEANFLVLGHMYRGARQLTSSRKIETMDDLAGLKMRVSPMKERLVTWRTFGASPTPMSWSEVFTALQQGVIEAQENPLATIQSASLDEVQDYLILTSHMANGFTFQFNADRFEALDAETQTALREAADEASAWYNDYITEEEAAILADLESKGMTVIEIDRAPFREKADDVVAEFPDLADWYRRMVAAD